jgi:hypothetical protein
MQVLHCMLKISDYYGTLYAGITINVKTSNYYGILYAGIVINVKNPPTIMGPYMRVL